MYDAGYVRLSRDDDKRNYSSIENQKLIINQYAQEHRITIERWYEDDGVSGYIFDRPGFNQLMEDINNKEIDTVYVKDFSRLGRHNAKILLLLDEFQERGIHLVVIDDHYDNQCSEDDTIGITTWFNERYVKDTSKKIRHALGAKQKDGTLNIQPPFGYKKSEAHKNVFEIVPKEAECIKMIFDLYIQGSGYRKIAEYLTRQGIQTPSRIRRERELNEGRNTKRRVTDVWTDSMVKEILDKDFYTGVLRLHTRERHTVHGKDKRVPKEEQYIFENHHPPIIDRLTYDLVQEIKRKRDRSRYKGSHGQWIGSGKPSPFGSCLYCKDCGRKLTPIERKTTAGIRKYYICSTYNTKGKKYCSKAHLIEEKDITKDVIQYITMCRNAMKDVIASYDIKDFSAEQKSVEEKCILIGEEIEDVKKQLKVLFSQKLKDISANPESAELIKESYDSIQKDLTERLQTLETKEKELKNAKLENSDVKEKLHTALDVVDRIIQKGTLSRKDIEIMIDRIDVDENGLPDIKLKYGLSELVHYDVAEELNRYENEIILATMRLIRDDERGYTSARYLSERLTTMGYKKSKKSVLPYIEIMIGMGIIKESENYLKPYTIIMGKNEIDWVIDNFIKDGRVDTSKESDCDDNLHNRDGGRRNAGDGI